MIASHDVYNFAVVSRVMIGPCVVESDTIAAIGVAIITVDFFFFSP